MTEIIANPYLQLGFLDPEVIAGRWILLSFPNIPEREPIDTKALSQWIYLRFAKSQQIRTSYTQSKEATEHTCTFYVYHWYNVTDINDFLALLQFEYPEMVLKAVNSYNSQTMRHYEF